MRRMLLVSILALAVLVAFVPISKAEMAKEGTTSGKITWIVHYKVLPMGKGKIPEVIGGLAGGLDDYYNGNYDNRFMIPPDGTICYPAVYVVD